jgi:obg-like ATPase 1
MESKKKKEEVPKKVLLGRPGNTLKMGIVGLPNVGKSTTYNLLSKLQVPAENYMFCTIEPNKARVEVPDERFDKLCQIYKPKSEVPASLTILDIAGLVKGASQNQGMGNAFLSHIQSVDGIFHVVRAFDDEEVQHYEGDVDPIRDLEIIDFELMEKDKAVVEKNLEELTKVIGRTNNKDSKEEKAVLDRVVELYKNNQNVRDAEWNYKEIDILNKYLFFSAKPVVYLVNVSEKDYINKKNKWLGKILAWINSHGGGKIIPYSVAYEKKLAEAASDEERAKIIAETKVESALGKIITSGYYALDLIHYFTSGEDEVKCWTIRKGLKAPQAAGVIHTDFERGFISAEVMKFEDLLALGTENEVKKEGKVRTEGKNYEVQDGDIIYFKFNVSDPGAKKKK